MKIEGPGKTSGPKGVSKTGAKKGVEGASFGSMIDAEPEISGAVGPSGVMSIHGIDALLSLQNVGDGTQGSGNRKARMRAEVLLDQLDKVRIGLLSGGIPVSTLRQLKHAVNTQRAEFIDPELAGLLDEIDLRVQVELAKFDVDA